MQLALNHPALPAGPDRLPFLLIVNDEPTADDGAEAGPPPAENDNHSSPPLALIAEPQPAAAAPEAAARAHALAEEYRQLYEAERHRAELLEQTLAGARVLVNETVAERDRWHAQAQRALSLADSLQRQLDQVRRPLRIVAPRRKRRRFLGLF